MKRSDLQLLRDAIMAGLQFEYPTAMGRTAKANPYDVDQKNGQVYLIFSKKDGGKLRRKLESCFVVSGSPGYSVIKHLVQDIN